ncbi:MAG TPA: type II CAAX endopeptidase family protein [Candidatus Polarisedimenticolaceae bacterium]|nr:type II CAAX endopeptidase family protein [Candidatus Polarisedimenticolaceae bacterium]
MERPVASTRHSIVFLAIVAAVTLAGFAAQNRPVAGGGLVETHIDVIPVYLSVTVMNWLLVLFVWKGIRKQGASFGSLIGERWRNAGDVLRDLGIAAIFWVVLAGTAWALHLALGEGHAKSVDVLLPKTPLEIAVWIVTSASAGFCEEYVFRGYVQRQLRAFTQSGVGAVLGQGLLFGLMHAYQGWRAVVVITSLGILFGTLAAWRKTLTVGMVAHGWQDIWAGWLSPMLMGRVG